MQRRLGLVMLVGLVVALLSNGAALAQDDVGWLLGQINGLRGALGLPAYTLNAQLSAAAVQHSQVMAATCDVSHTEADGSTVVERARANGYTGDWVSENIYGGQIARASDAWNFWLTSPIHYRGLTHTTVNEIGIGVAASACGQYFTLVFGQSAGGSSAPVPQVADSPASAAQAAAPQVITLQFPTAIPYVPPTATPTPTPTIPTLTPSATWTITPTHTATLTPSVPPPTETALVLPTVPALSGATLTAPAVSGTTPTLSAFDGGTVVAAVNSPLPPVTPVSAAPVERDDPGGGLSLRDLLPVALVALVMGIGAGAVAYWWGGE